MIITLRLSLAAAALMALLYYPLPGYGQWSFVSSPDLFNSDVADLSGGTVIGINSAFPDPTAYANAMSGLVAPGFTNFDNNSLTPQMATAYNQLVADMQSNAGGAAEVFLVAGDLTNGRWPQNANALQNNFGGGNTAQAIDNAAGIYYGWHRELFRQHGFSTPLAAIGDHDIGDNNWPTGSGKANQVINMKASFGRTMVDPLGLPGTWNGISSTAPARSGAYNEGSFVKQVNNVLFVTMDVFEFQAPGTQLHYNYGAVDANITGTTGDVNTHLGWLDAVLIAADGDATVDHVILQGHTPVLPGVRKQASSGMMMRDRDDSPFWQVLQSHDHQNGGKVRMYFGGEVHQVTSTKDAESDIVQLVHGNPPIGGGATNYVVFDVDGKQLDARVYSVDLSNSGGSAYWQVSEGNNTGTASASPGVLVGTMSIDATGGTTTYQTSGWLDFVDYRGLVMHYGFEDTDGVSKLTNMGSLGDLEYSATRNGNPQGTVGKFGRALEFDASGDYLRTNGLATITEGQQRTIATWVKTTATGTQAIFGYGQAATAGGEFNLQLNNGVLQLNTNGSSPTTAANPPIHDGEWHHVAVVVPNANDNSLGELLFYVDGVEYTAKTPDATKPVRTSGTSNSRIHIAANATNSNSGQQLDGALDDVAMWGSPLNSGRIKSIVNAGNEVSLRLNAIDMESIFDLFDAQSGSTVAGGSTWTYTTGLAGQPGDIVRVDDLNFAIVLDNTGNGVLGDVDVVLTVDRNTGSVEILNNSPSEILFDGYTIGSSSGGLDPSDNRWSSNFDRSVPEWIEANPTSQRLSEVRLTGSQTLDVNETVDLGLPFQPSPTQLGQPIEDIEFTYTTPEGQEVRAAVRYSGTKVNNLVLVVDPDSGQTLLRNASTFDIQLEGYTITSTGEELNPIGFAGLADAGQSGWIEANPTSGRMTEVNIDNTTLIPAGATYVLNDVFVGVTPTAGLALRYWANGDSSAGGAAGHVVYESVGQPGDFNGDGAVNLADYTVWRDNLGSLEFTSLRGLGDGSGTVDIGDYLVWKANFGATADQLFRSTATVPEATSLAIIASVSATILTCQTWRQASLVDTDYNSR